MSTRDGGVSAGTVDQPEPGRRRGRRPGCGGREPASLRRRDRCARRSGCARCTAAQVLRLDYGHGSDASASPADAAWTTRARPGLHRAGRRLPAGAVRGCATAARWLLRTPAGAAWPPACSRPRSRRCAMAGLRCRPSVRAWLGPCIGPRRFEVGADVLQAFGASAHDADPLRFASRPRADGSPRWLANLPRLARDRLLALGLRRGQRRRLAAPWRTRQGSSRSAATASPAAWPLPSGVADAGGCTARCACAGRAQDVEHQRQRHRRRRARR